jgi:hypothetical protein
MMLFRAAAAFSPVAFLLTHRRRKTLFLQAEAVEIPHLLDYYRGPDSAAGAIRREVKSTRQA